MMLTLHRYSLVKNLRFKFFLLYIGASFIAPSSVYAAEDVEQTQQELDSVNAAIDEIGNWLEEANARQTAAEQLLQEADLEVTRVSQAVAALESEVTQTESELLQLQAQQITLTETIESDQALLQQAIRLAYINNDQNFLKLLLNQEDISESSRMLHYSRVFSESQLSKIENYQASLDELAQVNESLTITLNELNSQQQQMLIEAEELNSAKEERAAALLALNEDIANRNSELTNLESSQAELAALLEEIRRAMEGITSFADIPPFADAQGNLPMPLAGSVTTQFGSRYGDGNLVRQGITISAAVGSPVEAVHAGRIVFSDWLRGSGLLVIIDHGNGYMSLYGSNQTLSLPAGEWVDAGDIVATSGEGGANGINGLYFEIRLRGEAQNPQNWLR